MRPNRHPLPNLTLSQKAWFSAVIATGLLLFFGTWVLVLESVYRTGPGESAPRLFGIGLAMLAEHDTASYWKAFGLHFVSIALLLWGAWGLFQKCSIRRRVKTVLIGGAILCVALDLSGWLFAPQCSSTNNYVGIVGAITALPLSLLALFPLFQMWVYRRWQPLDGKQKNIVIVGGGFAGLYAAMGLNRVLGYHEKCHITVVDQKNYFLFPPLLPSVSVGTIETRQISYPFRRIFETSNVEFRRAKVCSVDRERSEVRGVIEVSSDPETNEPLTELANFQFDYLVLAPGSLTQTFGTKGADEHAFFMRELNDAVVLRNHIIDCFERAAAMSESDKNREQLLRFVVVGAGPTGIETATEIYDLIHHVLLSRYPEIPAELPRVTVLQSGDQVLPGWHPDIVRMATKQLERLSIDLRLGSRVGEVKGHAVVFGGDVIPTRTTVWCAGVKPSGLLAHCNLPLEKSGRVKVQEDLRVEGSENIFVLGDAAHLVDRKTEKVLPPLGQVAFQQGSHTAKNLVRLLSGKEALPFRYFDFGGLVSIGEHSAAVNLLGVRLSGIVGWFVWRTLYLSKLVGFSNQLRVVVDWTFDLFMERSISQIREPRWSQNGDLALPDELPNGRPHTGTTHSASL
ncbi:MAG: NAD(P)/FAD-dependent oxidoreductase [Bdellovibrionales bacterium]|nr:NAD(P)/FAD-dependent oxidoreductase [Bdellovibrionales bacterium]